MNVKIAITVVIMTCFTVHCTQVYYYIPYFFAEFLSVSVEHRLILT